MKDYKFMIKKEEVYMIKDGKVYMECLEGSANWALAQMMEGRIVYQPNIEMYYEYREDDLLPIKQMDKKYKQLLEFDVDSFMTYSNVVSEDYQMFSYARFSIGSWLQSITTKDYYYVYMVSTIDDIYGIRLAGTSKELILDFKDVNLNYRRANIMPDFSDAKSDDTAFLYGYGLAKVWDNTKRGANPIIVVVKDYCGDNRSFDFSMRGIESVQRHPTLFESKEQAMAYYAEISKDIDGRIEYNEN